MEFFSIIKNRRSIRKYKTDAVPEDKLKRILEAGRLAPTAANRQPFLLYLIRNPKDNKKFAKALKQKWALDAPVIVAVFGDPKGCWTRSFDNKKFHFVDVAIAMDHLILTATSEGLGTCWIANVDPDKIKDALDVPDHFEFVALTPIGFADESPMEKQKKKFDELIVEK